MRLDPTILVSCGEVSGDLHASKLVKEIYRKWPRATVIALGGEALRAAGAKIIFDIREYSVMGFSEILSRLRKFMNLERALKKVIRNRVDLFIPVDYPGLNLRLAACARREGVPVLYYISPQVWAWGRGRVKKIARSVDFMAVILPFEEEIYRREGINAEFVGHPFVEDHALPEPVGEGERLGIGLLPGSRIQEVKRILPVLLDAALLISGKSGRRESFTIGRSPSVPLALYERILKRYRIEVGITDDVLRVMRGSRLLLVASGSATLQGALLETPLVVVYAVSYPNYLLARRLVKLEKIGLVNIILGEEVCPEFVQKEAIPDRIAEAGLCLLQDGGQRATMITRFRGLRDMLAGRGGCKRVVEITEDLLARR